MKINFIESKTKKEPIKLKSSHLNTFIIYIYNFNPEIIYQSIKKKIKQFPNLLKNIPIVLDISFVSLKVNWNKMIFAILSTGIKIIGIIDYKNNILKYTILNKRISLLNNYELTKKIFFRKPKIIYNQIRSGQKVYAENSDLIIINNVNSGAELIADGNIHIYGTMRGRALAGAKGDTNCQIFCTNLFAELISIAGEYWSMDQIPIYFNGKSVRFFLKNNILDAQKII